MAEAPRAVTPAGTFIGTLTENGVLFAGVPFALPPLRDLRFRPPQPLADASEEVVVDTFRAAPAQGGTALRMAPTTGGEKPQAPTGAVGSAMSALMAAAAGQGSLETSEDCLYLNVWAPVGAMSLPVVVWLYGGGFDVGSASPPFTDAASFARLANVVVVAINYRVGALGFGYWAGVGGNDWRASSNLGLQDQVAGLAWVRRNISGFGGDAANVTVMGESAGAFCIGTLLTMPAAKGLFDKAILQSGSTRRVYSTQTAETIAADLFAALGITSMEELQQVDVDVILGAQSGVVDREIGARNLPGGRSWGVIEDGDIIPADPHQSLRNGGASHIPILVGANHDEVNIFRQMLGANFAPGGEPALVAEMTRVGVVNPSALIAAYRVRLGADADIADVRAAFLGDAIYRRPAVETAAAQRTGGGAAWAYLFSASPMGREVGAYHGAEMAYIFDRLSDVGLDSPVNVEVRDAMVAAWKSFAYFGSPGWPAFSGEDVRQFGGDEFVSEPPRDAVLDAWPLRD